MGLSSSRLESVDEFVGMCSYGASVEQLMSLASVENYVVNACSTTGSLPLVAAMEVGNEAAVMWLLSDPFANLRINNVDKHGTSALLSACAAEENLGLSAMQLLLEKWSDVLVFNARDEENGWGALHHCAYHGHTKLAEMFIRKERSLDKPAAEGAAALLDHYKQSPLHVAAATGHEAMVRLLLLECYCASPSRDSRADLHWRDVEGCTALDLADTPQIRDLLLQHEASLLSAEI